MQPGFLDLDVLRTFVVAGEGGSFKLAARAADRTQSAVSIQMRKLQEQVGVPLFAKEGRRLKLSPAGKVLLAYSRRLLALNDEALQAVSGREVHGRVRLGLLQDFAETILPATLATFNQAHPRTETEVLVSRSNELVDKLRRKELDLVLMFGAAGSRKGVNVNRLTRVPMVWVQRADFKPASPVNLVMLQPPCIFRDTALKNLGSRRAWRQTFTSPSLSGIWAAVAAGLGISLRTRLGVPPGLSSSRRLPGQPPLPSVEVSLLARENLNEAADRLRLVLADTLVSQLRLVAG